MKIGIVVHSNTGNTLSVAEKLKAKLQSSGHSVDLKKIEPIGGENTNEADINKINFDHKPDVAVYDSIVFCAPVRGFSISPVLSSYLSKIDTLKNKNVDLFVTQHFAFMWMGGNHAISQMKSICEAKGATVVNTGIVNWKNRNREKKIQDVVDRLGKK